MNTGEPMPGLSLIVYGCIGLILLIISAVTWPWRRLRKVPEAVPLTLTIVIPAHNEEDCLDDTLEACLNQTVPAERIVVVDDGSTDGTGSTIRSYHGVEIIDKLPPTGCKAKAQNLAINSCDTDLVLTIDADTVIKPDFIEEIKKPFADPDVMVAAGFVNTKFTHTMMERGRRIEYLYGFHFFRPIQNAAGTPMVCSGCCSAFRREPLVARGGFPSGTVAEDMDYTWTQLTAGEKAVYATKAECVVEDPSTPKLYRIQTHRWMSGFFQNIRKHGLSLWRKPMLAVWALAAALEIMLIPLWVGLPFLLWLTISRPILPTLEAFLITDIFFMVLITTVGSLRRGINPLRTWAMIPNVYANRVFNCYYATKAMYVELLLVPLGWSDGLTTFRKGH